MFSSATFNVARVLYKVLTNVKEALLVVSFS